MQFASYEELMRFVGVRANELTGTGKPSQLAWKQAYQEAKNADNYAELMKKKMDRVRDGKRHKNKTVPAVQKTSQEDAAERIMKSLMRGGYIAPMTALADVTGLTYDRVKYIFRKFRDLGGSFDKLPKNSGYISHPPSANPTNQPVELPPGLLTLNDPDPNADPAKQLALMLPPPQPVMPPPASSQPTPNHHDEMLATMREIRDDIKKLCAAWSA